MAKSPPQVPPVDAQPDGSGEAAGNRDEVEFRLLDADAKSRENLNREADQRYRLRWISVGVVLAIIAGMGFLLVHVAHWLPQDPKMTGAVIALHLSPVIAMTSLAIALLVAAFRGFKDGDERIGTSLAAEAAKAGGLSPN